MRTSRKLIGIALCITSALAGTAVMAAPPGQDDGLINPIIRDDTFFPDLVDSATLTGQPIASGVLLDVNGQPMAGAPVALFAQPSADAYADLAIGEKVELLPLAKATTAADGTFDLRLEHLESALPMADSNGGVNFEIIGFGTQEHVTFIFPRHVHFSNGGARLEAETGQEPGGGSPNAPTQNVEMQFTEPQPTTPPPVRAAADLSPQTPLGPGCFDEKFESLGSRQVVVGAMYAEANVAKATFTYAQGAESELGIAVSKSGKLGSFKAGATRTISSNSSVTFAPLDGKGQQEYVTYFTYRKVKETCVTGWGVLTSSYRVEPDQFAGGGFARKAKSIPTAKNCTFYQKGLTADINATKAYSFTAGASLSSAIGIDLSARSGYSSSVNISVSFKKNGHLCGTNAVPTFAQRVVIKA